jgi:linoleoyl-CoA desaturase
MLLIYFVPYSVLIFSGIENTLVIFGMWLIMGFGMAGIGLSVMHDANHGSYSKNKKVNQILGRVLLSVLGGSANNWKIQHNVLHHTYTNVDGMDEDIDPGKPLRFTPHKQKRKAHKYQHLYAWFLYGLMTIMWATTKDFKQVIRYNKKGLLNKKHKSYRSYLWDIIFVKVFYYLYALVIPLLLIPAAWYIIVIGFIMMHFIAGLLLAVIFQSAHVMPSSEFPAPDKDGNLENSWAVHQLFTTTNFSPKSRIFSWFIGGLNYQVEHHIFPNICHVHYKEISPIVRMTALEYGLPYNTIPNFVIAIREHFKMLRKLGSMDFVPELIVVKTGT